MAEVIVDSVTRVRLKDLSLHLRQKLLDKFTLPNKTYYILQKMGKKARVPKTIICYVLTREYLLLPRFSYVLLQSLGFTVKEQFAEGEPVTFEKPHHELRDYQVEALDVALATGFGVITMPPGAGKTITGVSLIRELGRTAVWLAHTRELCDQAVEQLSTIGKVCPYYKTKRIRGEPIVVTTVQSLYNGVPPEIEDAGVVILDEAHHAPARTFVEVLSQLKARYKFGLTATPKRSDGLTPLMNWTLGPIIYKLTHNKLQERGQLVVPKIVKVDTGVLPLFAEDYTQLVNLLCAHEHRNRLIIKTIAENAHRYCLVCCARISHCNTLYKMLKEKYPDISAAVLTSKVPVKVREKIMERWRDKKINVVFATTIAEEGLDVKHLDRLFLVYPLKPGRRLTQAVGRVMRPAGGKKDAIVFDFVDPQLQGLFERRCTAYQKIGCEIDHSC